MVAEHEARTRPADDDLDTPDPQVVKRSLAAINADERFTK